MKKAYVTFKKNGKNISRKDFEVTAEDWREGAKGAEMIAGFQTHWFYRPTSSTVVLDGFRYYFRITYTEYATGRKGYERIVYLPEFKYTMRKKEEANG